MVRGIRVDCEEALSLRACSDTLRSCGHWPCARCSCVVSLSSMEASCIPAARSVLAPTRRSSRSAFSAARFPAASAFRAAVTCA
eukprot:5335639-Prymnesium_polylepis.1